MSSPRLLWGLLPVLVLAAPIAWTFGIFDTVCRVVMEHDSVRSPSVDDVLSAEQWARARAREVLA